MATPLSLVAIVLLILVAVWGFSVIYPMVVTNHAAVAHADQYWSALRVLERFQKQGGKDCVKLEVAVCPGDQGFTVRAYCEPPDMAPGVGVTGIWGYASQGVYVTGYRIDYSRWVSTCARDHCLEADVTILQRVLK